MISAVPFRNELEAAEAREKNLERELNGAKRHADELRSRKDGAGKKTKARRWSLRRKLTFTLTPLSIAGVFIILPLFARLTASGCGYHDVIVSAAASCPEAREALGDDIRIGYVGVACGSTKVGDTDVGYDVAKWRVPITGSRSSGVYHFVAIDEGNGWVMARGTVEVDGQSIDISQCSTDTRSKADTKSKTGIEPTTPAGILAGKCESGEARACRDLGFLYEQGNTVEKSAAQAQEYFERACTLGLTSACTGDSAEKKEP